jgi:hypothetical protein
MAQKHEFRLRDAIYPIFKICHVTNKQPKWAKIKALFDSAFCVRGGFSSIRVMDAAALRLNSN